MVKGAKKTEALVPVVLGKGQPEEKPDAKLVDETVDWIREKIAETIRKGSLEIGTYILEKFYGGSLAEVRSTKPKKGASFRLLAERCAEDPQIRMSKSALHRAVGIAAVVKELPADASYLLLASSHQGALLPVHDPEKIERLAKTILSKELSVPQVSELVKEKREVLPGKARGRPPKAAVLKALDQSLRAFSLDGGKRSFTAAQVHALDEGEAKEALETAEGLVERLNKLIEKLKSAEQR